MILRTLYLVKQVYLISLFAKGAENTPKTSHSTWFDKLTTRAQDERIRKWLAERGEGES
jgi:hypothetical protein